MNPEPFNPAVRAFVDGMRPCHEPQATAPATWAVYDTVTAAGLAAIDTAEVHTWLTDVVATALSETTPAGASGDQAAAVAAAVIHALAT